MFEQVLERCVREGLVGGEGFAIDGSLAKADANRHRGVPGVEADWSSRPSISRPVREYLAALDQSELEKSAPKDISLTDPAAQLSVAWGPASYAYSANCLIDIAAGIVVDVEATPAHKMDEINATKTMIERVRRSLSSQVPATQERSMRVEHDISTSGDKEDLIFLTLLTRRLASSKHG